MDKQPEMTGWSEGLGAWQPVLRGDRLYEFLHLPTARKLTCCIAEAIRNHALRRA
jgi:hypothetical protein